MKVTCLVLLATLVTTVCEARTGRPIVERAQRASWVARVAPR